MSSSLGKVITLGITGASGAAYARALACRLPADSRVARVFLVVTDAGLRLLSTELGISGDLKSLPSSLAGSPANKFELLPNRDIGASIASGSFPQDAMAVVPCSAGALASIASGLSSDLLSRAADVCLKQRRPLLLCLRETPLNRLHLENMLRAHDAGAVIMPAMPAFYFSPATLEHAVDQFVCRVLELLGLPQDNQYQWEGGA